MLASIPIIESIPFWYLLAGGLLLICVDMILTNDAHLMWVGAALILTAGANALKLPGELQVMTFVIATIVCIVQGRRFIRRLPKSEPAASQLLNLHGSCGVILHSTDASTREARAHIKGHGEWRVVSVCRDRPLAAGVRVRVVDQDGLVLVVEAETGEISPAG